MTNSVAEQFLYSWHADTSLELILGKIIPGYKCDITGKLKALKGNGR